MDKITDEFPYRLSVKTRVGFSDVGEWAALLDLYNRYSLSELIVHPRVGRQMYKGVPDMAAFEYALVNSRNPVVYNGDIRTADNKVIKCNTEINATMIGRGMVANPAIFREIKGGSCPTGSELMDFMSDICEAYRVEFDSEINVLHKLKEIWVYMGPYVINRGGGSDRDLKMLQKTRRLVEYKAHMRSLLSGLKST